MSEEEVPQMSGLGDHERPPVLDRIDVDSRTNLIIMRWIRFLMEKTSLEAIPELFQYYYRIGWISEEVEEYLVTVSEGFRLPEPNDEEEMLYEAVEDQNLLVTKSSTKKKPMKRKAGPDEEWRLTSEDHLKSWLFVLEIAGFETDKNMWYELRQKIDFLEDGLDDYCRI
ncbi:MAG TPA: FlaD/FlaE family flagellar protein [Thermoplasmata archaeon]|nr:FlaD/FlaE family flagellar protein [Thermoplasmata archaeon]